MSTRFDLEKQNFWVFPMQSWGSVQKFSCWRQQKLPIFIIPLAWLSSAAPPGSRGCSFPPSLSQIRHTQGLSIFNGRELQRSPDCKWFGGRFENNKFKNGHFFFTLAQDGCRENIYDGNPRKKTKPKQAFLMIGLTKRDIRRYFLHSLCQAVTERSPGSLSLLHSFSPWALWLIPNPDSVSRSFVLSNSRADSNVNSSPLWQICTHRDFMRIFPITPRCGRCSSTRSGAFLGQVQA